jgi:hypothetical protein
MAIEVILHMPNAEPILGEINNLPDPQDLLIQVYNPRMRDGKDLHFLQSNVTSVFWVVNQLSFIEILPGEDEQEIIGFVRE